MIHLLYAFNTINPDETDPFGNPIYLTVTVYFDDAQEEVTAKAKDAGGDLYAPEKPLPGYAPEAMQWAGKTITTAAFAYVLKPLTSPPFALVESKTALEVPVEPSPVDCVASFPFVVEARRGPRYILEFDELDNTTHTFTWDMVGYTGEPEYLCGSDEPAVIEWQGTGNKHGVLHGSSAAFALTIENNDALLRDFHTSDERKYKVSHYIEGVLNWRGWHMADLYNTPWDRNTFHATIQAYDGLASLNNKPYLNAAGVRYYGRARAIDVIFRCLRLLDLDLPVWLGVNIWEDTTDLNIEPLAQVYVDQAAYYSDENEPLPCAEVLERILQPYNAFIRQAKGALHILRYNEVQGPYQRRRAHIGRGDSEVVVDEQTEEFEELIQILYDTDTEYRESVQAIYAKPAYKEVTTVTHYGPYENFVQNGEFELWADNMPLFWELGEGLMIERISDGEKFMLGFPLSLSDRNTNNIPSLWNDTYQFPVKSEVGFTFSFDYAITVEDYLGKPGMEWVELPNFTLSGNTLTLDNPVGEEATALFNGVEVAFPNGLIQSGIPLLNNEDLKRIDTVYAKADGTITYVTGAQTAWGDEDTVTPEPDDALLITYITWEGNTPAFGSVSSALYVDFPFMVSIGEYDARQPIYFRQPVRQSRKYDFAPDNPTNTGTWRNTGGIGTRSPKFRVEELQGREGYFTATGTYEWHLRPLEVEGFPKVRMYNPYIRRNTMRGVQILIDNVRFQERAQEVERMLITGTNEGQINTEPYKLDLYHGSGIPRVEALLTLEDGTPAKFFNNGKLLQENTARDILNQHSRALLVLSATTTAGISPISVVKDFNLYYHRFFMDKYVHYVRRNHVSFEAIEVLGGVEELPPQDAIITEDGRPIVTENYNWVVKEK
ncbi:hypothetical protein C8N40_111129 [Pontibacter mucosus]|uniref:Uncharacterized protein n=1 Tax=Pontibacter mucosus TaxID=1649266 RepID=A0A2T5YD81_9BACT|nr:hypothetical protein [Pontibacter mucosus]PTX14464.1 hypothetical protein C8N40_111129 [Pontibacter mucosus]